MAMGTGLGDNTELFWAVLSHYPKRLGWRRTEIYFGGSKRWEWICFKMQTEWLQLEWVKNPKGFGFYL
jgi:hypothetical protein